MTNTKPVFHGSDIEKISEYYHIDQNSITNFAGNVNPNSKAKMAYDFPANKVNVTLNTPSFSIFNHAGWSTG